MTRRSRCATCAMALIAWLGVAGCTLRRPQIVSSRMIEPQLAGESVPHGTATSATEVRMLETQARAHIGRRLLHQLPDGELIEDDVWRWSSAPDRYLDTALRLEFAANRDVRLVESVDAPVLGVTLLAWQIEGEGNQRLLGAIEVRFTGTNHVVHTQVIRDSEPLSGGLPGDLSVAAGRLLGRLASEATKRVVAVPSQLPLATVTNTPHWP
jgi:hypothetical protein